MATKTTKATSKKVTKRAAKPTSSKATARKAAPVKKTAAKKTTKKAAAKTGVRAAAAVATPPAARKSKKATRKPAAPRTVFLPRAIASVDDDDVLMAHGGGGGGFGRCGGRLLSNRLEQQLCHRLGIAGVVHSHSPRHYEIRYEPESGAAKGDAAKDGAQKATANKVAAYAPMIVLRGRGREGKGVVIEAVEDPKAAILKKIIAFRAQYGQEFYVILVADDEVLDEVPLAAYDESCSSVNVHTLIARLAE